MDDRILRNELSPIWYYLLGLVLITLSFFHFSAPFFRELHSDMAIQALMARDFDFPVDAYYWGADRFGSLVPYLAHPLVMMGMDALWAISVIQYLLVLTGFFLISQLLGRTVISLLLLQFYCLPIYPWHQGIITGHVILQFTTFSLLYLYLMERILRANASTLLLLIFGLVGIIGVWCTEQLAVTWVLSWLMLLWTRYRASGKIDLRVPFLPGLIMGLGFILILWLKKSVPLASGGGFHALRLDQNMMSRFIDVTTDLIRSVIGFQDPLFTIYFLLFLLLLLYSLVKWVPILMKGLGADQLQRILTVTLVAILSLFVLTLLSQWVQDRRYQIRYFLPIIFLSGFFLFYGIQTLNIRWVKGLLYALSLLGMISLYVDQYIRFEIPHWSYDPADMKDQDQIGKASILGSYWTSYVMAVQSHPESVGTPNDQEQVRHEKSLISVMSSDTILVVGNRWLKEGIPDTLDQFGWRLIRSGPEMRLGKLYYAHFLKDSLINRYDLVRDCRNEYLVSDSLSGLTRFHIDEVRQVWIAERERIFLLPGKYSIRVQARVPEPRGKLLLAARRGAPSQIYAEGIFDLKQEMQTYEIIFTVDESVGFFEFNISIKGTTDAELSDLYLYPME